MKQKYMFFWNSLAFSLTQWMLAIWSLIPLYKPRFYIWKFSVHTLLKACLKDFEHNLGSMGWHHSNGGSEEELKSLLMRGKEENERAVLKLNFQKNQDNGIWCHHFMANRRRKKWKQWHILFSWAEKSLRMVTEAMKLKTLAPWKESYDKPRSILKSRDLTLPTKVHIVKAMAFPVVIYGCKNWTRKKAEHWKIDAFQLQCWRRLFRVPWIPRRWCQSILKEINHEYSLEGLMLSWSSSTLATWCKELTHWKRYWCWERLKAKGETGSKGWDGWMASLTQWTWFWANSGREWRTNDPGLLQSMGL